MGTYRVHAPDERLRFMNVQCSKTLVAQTSEAAKKAGISRSEFVRLAVKRYLAETKAPEQKTFLEE